MKTQEIDFDLPKQSKRKLKKPNKATSWLIVIAIFAVAFINFGIQYERRGYQEPLPANVHCLTALDMASKQLAGEDVDVLSAVQACRDTQGQVTVSVEK